MRRLAKHVLIEAGSVELEPGEPRKLAGSDFACLSDGVNAAVVGLLLAALYDPVWTSAILSASDFGLALAAFTLLVFWKTPPWLVVILTALAGWALNAGLML